MARKAATIEHLERLIKWAGEETEFRRITGVTQANLSSYLRGTKNVTWKWLRKNTNKVCGEPPAFIPILEGFEYSKRGHPNFKSLPNESGLYALYDSAMRVLYFGKATSLNSELRQTLNRSIAEVRPWTGKKNLKFKHITTYVSAFQVSRGDSIFRHDLESFILQIVVNNTFNKKCGAFKRKK
jgi:hypothetical protein